MRKYIDTPLVNPAAINRRLGAVEELYKNISLRGELGEVLSGVLDIERLMTKIVYGTANPRELLSVAQTADRVPQIKALTSACTSDELRSISNDIDDLSDIGSMINAAIVEKDTPITVREGGIFKDG